MVRDDIENWFRTLQDQICKALESLEEVSRFKEDSWERPGGGGGRSRIITKGNVIEKGGVNFSAVYGPTPEKILKALDLPSADFYATGVSIVIHPINPNVPIIHMNTRYFEMTSGHKWFGGGIDLTPHYVNEEDARFFHYKLKETCDKYHPDFYKDYKQWADDYFFIKHRNETRGIGGIFFDKLNESNNLSFPQCFEFVQEVGRIFAPLYIEIVNRNKNKPYGIEEKNWQALRRGRYVEFNLVYDRGTKFGLDTDGRTESILMSMPPLAIWEYAHNPEANSMENTTLQYLKKGINWVT